MHDATPHSVTASDKELLEYTPAILHLAAPTVCTGSDVCRVDAMRPGFSIKPDALEAHRVLLRPIRPDTTTLADNGVELLDVSAELRATGLTEDSFDVTNREHRLAVGRALISAAQRRFGASKRIVHLGDTSRISGGAVYGEPTVRDTGSASARNAHYVAHVDKYLPGIAESMGQSGALAGAEAFLREYWRLNGDDWERAGLRRAHVADAIVADAAAAVNLWVALTPGGVAQSPLAVADTSSVCMGGSAATVPVVFPGKLSDTLTLLGGAGMGGARWLWRPRMRFGEALLFSTTATPHTATWLEGAPPARRVSAEIRLLVLEKEAGPASSALNLRPLFLNGVNLAWHQWATDFVPTAASGDGLSTYCELAAAMRFVRENGGNALRVWLFPEPHLARSEDGTLRAGVLEQVRALADLAAAYQIFLVPVLFNGALVREASDCALFADDDALDALLATLVTPLAAALRGHARVSMFEVINEPEGLLAAAAADEAQHNPRPGGGGCADVATALHCPTAVSLPGWNAGSVAGGGCTFGILRLQHFVNRVAAALRRAAPEHLVTMGSWSHCVSSHAPGAAHLWSDACLVAAGGDAAGTLDVYQLHSYPKLDGGTAFHPRAPAVVPAAAYGLGRPVLIGEVSSRWVAAPAGGEPTSTAANASEAALYAWARRGGGYAGVFGWAWSCDTRQDGGCVGRDALAEGMRAAAAAAAAGDDADDGAGVGGGPAALPASTPRLRNFQCECASADEMQGVYTCREQAAWGKCALMDGACVAWCKNCGEDLRALPPRPTCEPPRPPPGDAPTAPSRLSPQAQPSTPPPPPLPGPLASPTRKPSPLGDVVARPAARATGAPPGAPDELLAAALALAAACACCLLARALWRRWAGRRAGEEKKSLRPEGAQSHVDDAALPDADVAGTATRPRGRVPVGTCDDVEFVDLGARCG